MDAGPKVLGEKGKMRMSGLGKLASSIDSGGVDSGKGSDGWRYPFKIARRRVSCGPMANRG